MIKFILLFMISLNAFSALDKTSCATSVVAKIKAQNPKVVEARLIPFWESICDGIIDHFKNNAVINSTGTGTAVISSGSSAGTWPTTDTNVGTIQ